MSRVIFAGAAKPEQRCIIVQVRTRCRHCKIMLQRGEDAVWVKDTMLTGVMQGMHFLHHPKCATEVTA